MNALFGSKHLLILAICVVATVGGLLLTRKWSLFKRCHKLLHIGVISELVKVIYFILANEAKYDGILPKSDLPFQLCSMQILFALIYVLTEKEKIRQVLLSVMLPGSIFGGIAALLVATTSSLNGGWPITVQYFGYHVALIVFGLGVMIHHKAELTVWHYVTCLKCLLAIFLLAVYLNSMLYDTGATFNFMYVAEPPAKGLPFLNEDRGWLVYIRRYALLVVGCVTLFYIRPIVQAVKVKLTRTAAAAE